MHLSWFHIFGLALCLIFAGCGGYSTDGSTTQTKASITQPDEGIVVKGGELPVDPNQTFGRVQELMGTNGSRPTVRVGELEPRSSREYTESGKFNELMGSNVTHPAVTEVAGGTRDEFVGIRYTDEVSPGRIERTLAHEFAHTLQPNDLHTTIRNNVRRGYRRTTDAEFARIGIVEGVAVYVADRYTEKYLEDTRTRSDELQASWQNESVGIRSYWAPYYYGQQYVKSQVESGVELDGIYANPPRTAEQVLHGYTPDEEPRKRLDVNATSSESPWDLTTEDTKGELFVRHTLERELSTERAKRAATGWGNDRVFTYYNGTNVGHVWVVRWDDADEASEFEAALAVFLDGRYERNGTSWSDGKTGLRIDRTNSDTVTLVAGNRAFSNATSLATNGSEIRVATDGKQNRP